jgi:hypothetical protein
METVFNNQLIFESLFCKEVITDFAADRITSDAAGLLLREIDQRYRLTEKASQCLRDSRQAPTMSHAYSSQPQVKELTRDNAYTVRKISLI